MNDTTWNTFIYCLKKWTEESHLFKDPEEWLEGLKQELVEIPRVENEIKALSLEIALRLQSSLLDEGFNTDEVCELMRLPVTAIDIIDSDGGLEEWRKHKRSCQHSAPMIS